MTAATYKIERKAIDTDYMAALAVIDTEYQYQCKQIALVAPLASAYMVKIKTANRAYFASVHALGERYSKD